MTATFVVVIGLRTFSRDKPDFASLIVLEITKCKLRRSLRNIFPHAASDPMSSISIMYLKEPIVMRT